MPAGVRSWCEATRKGAFYPFWSPDRASVGFFADGKLKRIDIVGGPPQVLADASGGRGGAWNRDGAILFAPNPAAPLWKVPAAGDEAMAVTRLETEQASHRFPQFPPNGRHFIYFAVLGRGVYAGSLDGSSSKWLASADAPAVVSPSGFLLFLRQTTLFAQAFDVKRQKLSGSPFLVAEVAVNPTLPAFGSRPDSRGAGFDDPRRSLEACTAVSTKMKSFTVVSR